MPEPWTAASNFRSNDSQGDDYVHSPCPRGRIRSDRHRPGPDRLRLRFRRSGRGRRHDHRRRHRGPHADILNYIADNLADDAGLEIEIEVVNDYVTPNVATADGSVEANFFQTLPYLEEYNEANGTDLTAVAPVHIEPLGLYSEKATSSKRSPTAPRSPSPATAPTAAAPWRSWPTPA
ncbi:hypothetical protein GCM10029992_25530 [Glycomyces albus]